VYGIATDAAGNVAIAGTFLSPILFGSTTLTSAGLGDAYVVKLASDLTPSWAMRWGDAQNQEANAVAFDSSGNLTVVGDFFGAINIGPAGGILTAASDTTGSGNDLFVAHLAGSSGNATCALRYGDPLSQSANNVFIPRSAAGTNKDMVFASGSQVQGSVLDFGAAGKFDLPQGDGQGQLWIARF
jgi:hypothetical protein